MLFLLGEEMVSIIYMVAGMSSRFGGKIKQFAKVGPNGETLMELSINQAIEAGFDKIVLIVGEKTELPFKEMFGNEHNGVQIIYAKQTFDPKKRDKPWGTCDAVVCAKESINEDFVVCNGDDIYGLNTFKKLKAFAKENKDNECATMGYLLGTVVPDEGVVNRGIFTEDENNYLIKINETLNVSKSKFAEMGLSENSLSSQNIYFLKKEVVNMLDEKNTLFKEKNKGNRTAECYLPKELSVLITEGKIKVKVLRTKDKCYGITNPDDEEKVRDELIAAQNLLEKGSSKKASPAQNQGN